MHYETWYMQKVEESQVDLAVSDKILTEIKVIDEYLTEEEEGLFY